MKRQMGIAGYLVIAAIVAFWPGRIEANEVGDKLPREGDEIVVCGQLFHTTTPVVTWMDPGGYDAYRVERRFAPFEEAGWEKIKDELDSPNRYGLRKESLSAEQIEKLKGGGWSLEELRDVVDQFVMHYDVCGLSRRCFEVLHDHRCLSVHFMLDVDGTIYQTLDLKERAWHASSSNGRSIGIEIAQIGAYPAKSRSTLDQWYKKDSNGKQMLTYPSWIKNKGIRTPDFVGYPARPEIIFGEIQQTELYQYDYTPEQYEALAKLTATLCRIFPKLKCDYPKDASGELIPHVLPEAQLRDYQGLIGHYHIQTNKTDPGPAFDWPRVVDGAKALMAEGE